jgi:hypothetical protein
MEVWFDLIVEDPDSRCSIGDYRFTEDYVKLFYKHPRGMVGVDSSMVDDRVEGVYPPWGRPGPNTYSAYPSFLNRYVKEQRLLTLEEAVREVHSIARRGLQPGGEGDHRGGELRRHPPNRLGEPEDEQHPQGDQEIPDGIRIRLRERVAVIEKDRHTGARPGRVLRRKPDPTSSI